MNYPLYQPERGTAETFEAYKERRKLAHTMRKQSGRTRNLGRDGKLVQWVASAAKKARRSLVRSIGIRQAKVEMQLRARSEQECRA